MVSNNAHINLTFTYNNLVLKVINKIINADPACPKRVASAAPFIPYSGIKKQFSVRFINRPNDKHIVIK